MEEIRLPVSIHPMMLVAPTGTIYYPHVHWPKNLPIQNKINYYIIKKVNQLFNNVYLQSHLTQIIGDFEVKNNQRGIISITFNNFATGPKLAHPIDNLSSLSIDIKTGNIYSLASLFKKHSPYIRRLSELIKQQMIKRKIPSIQKFDSIHPYQDFYIADKTLVIFFQRNEISPHHVGYLMFPISIFEIEDIIDKNGPLGKMLSDF